MCGYGGKSMVFFSDQESGLFGLCGSTNPSLPVPFLVPFIIITAITSSLLRAVLGDEAGLDIVCRTLQF